MGTRTGERTPLGDVAVFDGGLTEIAPATWAWLQPNGGLGESNAGLVVGDGAALLVDTLWDERLTAAMLAAIVPVCERAGAPIAHLFNTHGDGDHWYGNGLLGAGVEMIASAPAIEQMRSEPPSMLTRLAPVGTLAGLAGRAAAACPVPTACAGSPDSARCSAPTSSAGSSRGCRSTRSLPRPASTSAAERSSSASSAPPTPSGTRSPGSPTPAPCSPATSSSTASCRSCGPVRSATGSPPSSGSRRWDPEAVLGGHGPVGGVDEVRALRDHWTWLREQVLAAGGDADPAELAERLIRSAEFEPWREWRNPERTLVNVARIAATEPGGGGEIGMVERIKLIAAMGSGWPSD